MYQIGSELSVPQFFYRHVGAYIGNDLVFHNHPERGEEIISVTDFAQGRPIIVTKPGVSNVATFFARVKQALSNPGKYHPITNNCEHTVSKLRTGIATTPQVVNWAFISIALIALGVAIKRSK